MTEFEKEMLETMKSIRNELTVLSMPPHLRAKQRELFSCNHSVDTLTNIIDYYEDQMAKLQIKWSRQNKDKSINDYVPCAEYEHYKAKIDELHPRRMKNFDTIGDLVDEGCVDHS